MMNIKDHIKKNISDQGYITLDHFLSIVVPFYYSNQDSLGKNGDFITAPEFSQLFGEMIGVYTANYWLENCSNNISIVELGAGRGYLMSDFLRATKHVKGLHNAIDKIVFYEVSPKLRSCQQQNLIPYINKCLWFDQFLELKKYVENNHCVFIANEFFDALPIKQFQFINGNWYELCLVLDKSQNLKIEPLIKTDIITVQDTSQHTMFQQSFLEYSLHTQNII